MEANIEDPTWIARLTACLEVVLRESRLPIEAAAAQGTPTTWAELRASLAAHNLGMVEVARPAAFSWPGYWIGVADDDAGASPVVMYGSPSARIWPSGVEGVLIAGYVLAPFDPSLPRRQPYGTGAVSAGEVTALFVAAEATGPMQERSLLDAVAGRGLVGDRYHRGGGTFSGPVGHEVTLVEADVCDDLPVTVADLRRNIVTSGIDLNALVGAQFGVGGAVLVGRRLCEPCRHLEELLGARIVRPLVHRAGLRADILRSGPIAVGDSVIRLG